MKKRFLDYYSSGKVGFACRKKPFGTRTKRYVALLALTLLCLLTFIIWSNKVQALKAHTLWHFYFNKVCSCKILICNCREVLPPWHCDSLP